MNPTLFFSIFFSLIALYTMIGLWASSSMNSVTDYFLAGRQLGLLPLVFTFLATQIGGGMLLGTTEEAFRIGLHGFAYTIGMAIGFLLLAFCFAQRMQRLHVSTTAELFETRYGSVTLKQIASLLSIATMSGILIGQIIGSKKLLLSLGFFNEYMFIAFWLFTIWYTMAGGLRAVILTDCVQITFIILMFMGLCSYIIWTNPTAITNIIKQSNLFSADEYKASGLAATFLMPILFSLIEQDLAQRFFAARTPLIARLSAFFSAIGLLVFASVPIFFGMHARVLGITVLPNTSPLMPYISFFSSDLVAIFAACAIIAAITSTADSLLCAISSNVAQDFNVNWIKLTPINRSRLITALIGCITLLCSYWVTPNVIGTLIASYELSVNCLLIPLLVAYYKTNLKASAAYGSIIGGLVGFVFFRIYTPFVPKELAALALSGIGYLTGTFLIYRR